MSSKEILIKELENLGPLEILRLRSYIRELKSYQKKKPVKMKKADMNSVRKSLSIIKGSLSDFISEERADRI